MQVKILGCGPSYGVPSLTRGFGLCDPTNPKNFRLRSSILVRENGTNILIDSGPEIRLQLLQAGRPSLDAVLYTHEHYDHMGGADDLRVEVIESDKPLPVYMGEFALPHFRNMLEYLFQSESSDKTVFDVRLIRPYHSFEVNGVSVLPLPQKHGDGESIGYRIGSFAYSTDVVSMDERAFKALKGIKIWLLGVVTPIKNKKHIDLKTALKWIEKVGPEQAYITHMGARMDYEKLFAELPPNIRPVYDGMEIDIG